MRLAFEEWVPATSRLEGVDLFDFIYQNNETIRSNNAADELLAFDPELLGLDPFAVTDSLRITGGPAGSTSGELDALVVLVFSGSFDPAAVASYLENNGATDVSDYRQYALFEGLDGESNLVSAVNESHVLAAIREAGRSRAMDTLRTVIDTHAGEGSRYGVTNADQRELVRGFDDPDYYVQQQPDEFFFEDDAVSGLGEIALGFSFLGAETELLARWLFESQSAVAPAEMERWADDEDGLETYEYSVSTQGRVVELRGTTPTRLFDGARPGTPTE